MIHGVVKTSYVDYPGRICTMIFIGGCNFRCGYCHNPEIVFKESPVILTSEVIIHLKKRLKVVNSVCISGGEPTIWVELPTFIKSLKDIGMKVKLDTNGSNPDMLRELIDRKMLDYIAMDIKAPLEKYSGITGVETQPDKLLLSINMIKESGIDYEFRTTVHSALHTREDIIRLFREISPAKRFVMQAFHNRDRYVGDPCPDKSEFDNKSLEGLRCNLIQIGGISEILIR